MQLHAESTLFELRYESFSNAGRALCFPCDEGGHVALDALSERALANLLFVRAAVGRDYAYPKICAMTHDA
ncbi:MAG: hypothetical protein M3O01_11330 [Pseudomonadota bacterium]|nr:hypothetical protein [Pseudomonadota bacterium]